MEKHLILKKKNGSADWKYYNEVFDLKDFNSRFHVSVSRYFENEEDIRHCENWNEVYEVLDTVENSSQAATFELLKIEKEEKLDDGRTFFNCKDLNGCVWNIITMCSSGSFAEVK